MQLSSAQHQQYEAIIAPLRAELAALPAPLAALCVPSFAALAAGEWSRLTTLLPWLLNDLLPVPDAQLLALGRAGLLAWWYGQLYDDLLDGDGTAQTPVLVQVALLHALEAYRGLGLAGTPAWTDLLHRMAISAAAHARELGSRFAALHELSAAQLAVWDHALLVERAAPFLFMVVAQAQLAGLPIDRPPATDLLTALGLLVVARQIGDDTGDWLDDLRHGRLNYVAAQLIGSFEHERPAAPLDLERLAGYQASAERAWAAIARTHTDACMGALAQLTAYGPTKAADLIQAQAVRGEALFAALHTSRVALRQLLGAELPEQRG